MSNPTPQPLRVEQTILDSKLFRPEVKFLTEPVPHLLYCTDFKDAVSPPFPAEGKSGLSILIGKREHFRHVEVPLLWELERKRGRARMAVITNLRGKDFIPLTRELASILADPYLLPTTFLRRRQTQWDSLDFFSSGCSPSMEGAAPRLKRLKQRGWEIVVDRLGLADVEIKDLYFETLHVDRLKLQESVLSNFSRRAVSIMVGVAGQCLQKDHLSLFLRESLNQRFLESLGAEEAPDGPDSEWNFLAKRSAGKELLLLANGDKNLQPGDVLTGPVKGEKRNCELQVSETLQKLEVPLGESGFTVVRVKVDWRYRPARQIPVRWKQNSTSPAGSSAPRG